MLAQSLELLHSHGVVCTAAVALNNKQLRDGYVLLCVARPKGDCTLDVGVDSHDTLYRNPFASPLRSDELKPDIATPLEDAK